MGSHATSRHSRQSLPRWATTPASSRRSTPTTRSRAACTAARAPSGLEPPEGFVPLGRTAGFPANGAVSNLVPIPPGVLAMRRELREGGYDVVHIHEPVVPLLGWDAPCSTAPELPLVGTFHTYSENALTNGIGTRSARRGG